MLLITKFKKKVYLSIWLDVSDTYIINRLLKIDQIENCCIFFVNIAPSLCLWNYAKVKADMLLFLVLILQFNWCFHSLLTNDCICYISHYWLPSIITSHLGVDQQDLYGEGLYQFVCEREREREREEKHVYFKKITIYREYLYNFDTYHYYIYKSYDWLMYCALKY